MVKKIRFLILSLLFLMFAATGGFAQINKDMPFWKNSFNNATFARLQNSRLRNARLSIDKLLAVKGKRTVRNTLVPYDNALIFLNAAVSQSGLMKEVHPDKNFRAASEKIEQKVSEFNSALSLNREVYEAISAIDPQDADKATAYYIERLLRDFRLAGVDKDEATRQKIKKLRDELVVIGQEFAANIRDDKGKVAVNNVAEFDGLPQDFIDGHKPDAAGKIYLTTDYVDYFPVIMYAKSDDLRRRMFVAFNNRAYPQNSEVLSRMRAKRFELANLLGFKNWADYITADKMIKNSANAADFIAKIAAASADRAKREYEEVLGRKQKDVPDAKFVNRWEYLYYAELIGREKYKFDSQSVRPYFSYRNVKQGVLDVTAKLFGITFKQVKNAEVWDSTVECWEIFENGKLSGRFYLDMHPREGKYNHAAQFDIKVGVANRQLPEAALVCNFPGGKKGESDLMDHDDVVTFFHEFGHLLHSMFAGKQKWLGIGGISNETDFVEAPSQMLEEWANDAKVLQTFAKHYKTNQPIPARLVEELIRAGEFGKGLRVRNQMVYAAISLRMYDGNPAEVDSDKMVKRVFEEYSPFPNVEGTHLQNSFGHLDGYSAIYYTYMWSLVIAKDMFGKFDRNNLLAEETAEKYRRDILEPGGSQPAERLVETFLGRKTDFAAYRDWLNH